MKKGHRTTLIVVDALFSLYDIAMVLKDKLQLLLIMQIGVKSPDGHVKISNNLSMPE